MALAIAVPVTAAATVSSPRPQPTCRVFTPVPRAGAASSPRPAASPPCVRCLSFVAPPSGRMTASVGRTLLVSLFNCRGAPPGHSST